MNKLRYVMASIGCQSYAFNSTIACMMVSLTMM